MAPGLLAFDMHGKVRGGLAVDGSVDEENLVA
jgi:hypothetical protein